MRNQNQYNDYNDSTNTSQQDNQSTSDDDKKNQVDSKKQEKIVREQQSTGETQQQNVNRIGNQSPQSSFDNDSFQQRQRIESFSAPNQSNNKSRRSSDLIPQTPMFVSEKSKKPLLQNIQGNQNLNQRKQQNSIKEFHLNQGQNQNAFGINLDMDQQSNEIDVEVFNQQNQFNDQDYLELSKSESYQRKKLVSQKSQNKSNNNMNFNNRNIVQSNDLNQYPNFARQSSNQEDKKNRQPAFKQNKQFKEKELNNLRNEQVIRDNNWVQPSSKASKKFQDKKDQNYSMQSRDINNPNFERLEQMENIKQNRKRRQTNDSYLNASDSDEMDDEAYEKNCSILKICEVQKKRMQDRLVKLNEQRESEKKNQFQITQDILPMSTSIQFNRCESKKIDIEEQIQETSKKVPKSQEVLQKKTENIFNQPEVKGLFDQPLKPESNSENSLPAPSIQKQNSISIAIPDKPGNKQKEGETALFEKKGDGLKVPLVTNIPLVKPAQIDQPTIFNTNKQPQIQENKLPETKSSLFNNIKPQENGILTKIQNNVVGEQTNNTLINSQTLNNISKSVQNNTENNKNQIVPSVMGGLFASVKPNTTIEVTSSNMKKQEELIETNKQQTQPNNLGGLFDKNQQETKKEVPSTGLFSKQAISVPLINAGQTATQSVQGGLFGNLANSSKEKVQPTSENVQPNKTLFANLSNVSGLQNSSNQVQTQAPIVPPAASETSTEKKSLFGNLVQNKPQSGLFSNLPTIVEQKSESNDSTTKQQTSVQFKLPQNTESEQKKLGEDKSNQGGLFSQNMKANEPKQAPQNSLFGGVTNQEGGLFSKSIISTTTTTTTTVQATGGLFGANPVNEQNSSEQKSGGLFGAKASSSENSQSSILSGQTNQTKPSLFGNLANVQTQNNNTNQSLFGQASGGLFSKSNTEQPKNDRVMQTNGVSVTGTKSNAFNKQYDEQKNKPQSIEFSPLPEKVMEDNGQLFTQVNNINGKQPQESTQQNNFSIGDSANQKAQPSTETKSQSLFADQKPKPAGSLFNPANAQPGLFASLAQPSNNTTLPTQQTQEQKKGGFFSNLAPNPQGQGLFGAQTQGSLFNSSATAAGTSLFKSNPAPQGGLFTNLAIPQNVKQNTQ